MLDVETGEATDLARHEAFQDAWGSVSPEGQLVAFNRTPKGRLDWQPAIVELATGEVRFLPTELTKAMFPRWSADGKSLILYGGEPGAYQLYELDVTSGDAVPRAIEVDFGEDAEREKHGRRGYLASGSYQSK